MSPDFLLIYDWACGQVVSLEPVADAEAARSAAAWIHADDPSIEVRVVSGDDEQACADARRRALERDGGGERKGGADRAAPHGR
jgi:hypothetical protein